MKAEPDSYNEVVATYIHVLKLDSPQAANAIAEILSTYGSRAALRSTLVITLLKMEVEKNQTVKNHCVQMDLIKDFPEALPLLERAITACLQAWGIAYRESSELGLWHPCGVDNESTLSPSMLPPV